MLLLVLIRYCPYPLVIVQSYFTYAYRFTDMSLDKIQGAVDL